jgi:hypothetical protein
MSALVVLRLIVGVRCRRTYGVAYGAMEISASRSYIQPKAVIEPEAVTEANLFRLLRENHESPLSDAGGGFIARG